MTSARRYFDWQFRLAEGQIGKRVLEVGCGLGNFTRLLLDRELVVAIDTEPECIAKLHQSYGDRKNLLALQMDVLDPAFLQFERCGLDSIVCLNVLEHVRDDRHALRQMHTVLKEGGKAVLIVPAFESLYGPIDRNLGHYRRYSKQSMTAAAESAGFAPVMLRYLNSIGFLGWWWNAKVLKKQRQSPLQIGVFDRCIVPVMSRLEDRIEPPFGQSIFVVLIKMK